MTSFTPDRWERIEDTFARALDVDPDDRGRFLEEACGSDESLLREVTAMIQVETSDSSFLDEPLIDLSAAAPRETEARWIDAYRLIRPLGRGGMGTVFLAKREDDAFEQFVALKVLRADLESNESIQRFKTERQILATLRHDHIAGVLDGGSTRDGHPYLVMEYVQGTQIMSYVEEQNLPVNERLRLFVEVCSAVHYAHTNLIVHRDLKPSNILVDATGKVKLLDFGIAKLLDPEQAVREPLTRTGSRLMTPEYASPEQIRGDRVTTGSDVYSLGALLYELLSGRRAYDLGNKSPAEIERIVCETPVKPPSSTVTDDRRRRQLRGDLDNIVLRAMRRDLSERYVSVQQLSSDVERHLDGLPVTARAPTVRYRMAKFARRHRFGVTSAALLAVLFAGATVITTIQSNVIRDQVEQVSRERDRAEEVTNLMIDVFKTADPSESNGRDVTARELLDVGAANIGRNLADQPELQTEMLSVMSRVYLNLAAYDSALSLARRSLELRRSTYGLKSREAAAALNELALVKKRMGDFRVADSMFRRALAIQRSQLDRLDPDLAYTLTNLGTLQQQTGEFEEALSLHEEALEIRRLALGSDHPAIARSLNNLATLAYETGDYDRTESHHREALEILTNEHGREHQDVAISLTNLAAVLDAKGEWSEAEDLYREAIRLRRRMLGDSHPDLAYSLNNLGAMLRKRGELAAAEPAFVEAIEIFENALGSDHPNVAVTVQNLGSVYRDMGQWDQAAELYNRSLSILAGALHEHHPNIAIINSNSATVLRKQGRLDEAEELLRASVTTLASSLPDGHTRTAEAMLSLGLTLLDRGDVDEGCDHVTTALNMQRENYDSDDWHVFSAEVALGICMLERGERETGRQYIEDGRQGLAAVFGENHRLVAEADGYLQQ